MAGRTEGAPEIRRNAFGGRAERFSVWLVRRPRACPRKARSRAASGPALGVLRPLCEELADDSPALKAGKHASADRS